MNGTNKVTDKYKIMIQSSFSIIFFQLAGTQIMS